MDQMLAVGAELATVTGALWVATEVIGRATSLNKLAVAIALGPVAGVASYATGFLTALPDCPHGDGICKWFGAAFAGLITTFVAKGFHDLIGNTLLTKLGVNDATPGA